MKEAEFIQRLLSKSERNNAFEELLSLYHERLYWHIRKLVITHENTDDVLQNTFLRIFKSLPNFKQKSSLHTWMYRIAYNEAIRFLDQNKKKSFTSLYDIDSEIVNSQAADTYFDGDELQMNLKRILADMPEKQRHIFQMKYFDYLKFNEIAEILKQKESTVKTHYYQAAKFIKKKILTIELFTETRV